ncbi:MAG: phosphoribosylformylglycinamidine synthase I [Candidatus Helarchaeota archaeon]
MKIAIIKFPGSNCDLDAVHLLNTLKLENNLIWHKRFDEKTAFQHDAVILPGGFSYGDHLRAGIIAAYSPAMTAVKSMAREGKPVLGICNGFQSLIESGLLEGALLRNDCLTFVCKWTVLKTETRRTVFTRAIPNDTLLNIPIAHGEGRYFNEERALKEMVENDQIVFRYVTEKGVPSKEANPNGSIDNIAGICNLEGNVVGLMPHPERASESILSPFNTSSGTLIFQSLMQALNC